MSLSKESVSYRFVGFTSFGAGQSSFCRLLVETSGRYPVHSSSSQSIRHRLYRLDNELVALWPRYTTSLTYCLLLIHVRAKKAHEMELVLM